jgi:drug/metabolite transporter (DMT)-like permease
MRSALLLILSALSFALATVAARYLLLTTKVPVMEITFLRFFGGAVTASTLLLLKRQVPKPRNVTYVMLRALFNTGAVLLFFLSLKYTSVAKANMLNMTYPFFVVLLAPFINREKSTTKTWVYLALAIGGIYLILSQGPLLQTREINVGDAIALASGFTAAFAVSFLREARKYDTSLVILFYLMLTGTITHLPLFHTFILPETTGILLLAATTIFSVAGQFFITEGYRGISAADGAIISSSRIPFAVIGGYLFLSENVTGQIIAGSLLLIAAFIGIARSNDKK